MNIYYPSTTFFLYVWSLQIHFIYILVYFARYSFAVCLYGDSRHNTRNEGHSLFSKNRKLFHKMHVILIEIPLVPTAWRRPASVEMLMWVEYIQVNRIARDYVTSVNLKIDSPFHLFLCRIATYSHALAHCSGHLSTFMHESVDCLWPWATLWAKVRMRQTVASRTEGSTIEKIV